MRHSRLAGVVGGVALIVAGLGAQAEAHLSTDWLAPPSEADLAKSICSEPGQCARMLARRPPTDSIPIDHPTAISFDTLPDAESSATTMRETSPAFQLWYESGVLVRGLPDEEQSLHLKPLGNGMIRAADERAFVAFWDQPSTTEPNSNTDIPPGTERRRAIDIEWVGIHRRVGKELWLERVQGVVDSRTGKLEPRFYQRTQLKQITPFLYAYRSRESGHQAVHLVLPAGQAQEISEGVVSITAPSAFSYVTIPIERGLASTVTMMFTFGASHNFERAHLGSIDELQLASVRLDVVKGHRESAPTILITPRSQSSRPASGGSGWGFGQGFGSAR